VVVGVALLARLMMMALIGAVVAAVSIRRWSLVIGVDRVVAGLPCTASGAT
jgi:hypothetical protein